MITKRILLPALLAILLALIAYTHTASANRIYTTVLPLVTQGCQQPAFMYRGSCMLLAEPPTP